MAEQGTQGVECRELGRGKGQRNLRLYESPFGLVGCQQSFAQFSSVFRIVWCKFSGLFEYLQRFGQLPILGGDNTAQEPGVGESLVEVEDGQAMRVHLPQVAEPHGFLCGVVQLCDLLRVGVHASDILCPGLGYVTVEAFTIMR